MPKIKVPASTANMGPGFDSLGMALSMYNEIEFSYIPKGLEIIIPENDDSMPIETDETNLIYRSICAGLEATGVPMPGLRIVQKNIIPQTRGLGSSSACIVGGIIAANIISGGVLSTDAMIDLATKIEGHPDNVLPTFVGGMTVGALEGETVKFVRIAPPEVLKCCVFIPDFPLSTEEARHVLPDTVSMKDAIFNISHASLLVGAMIQGRLDLLPAALGDRLHQDYRKKLIHGYDEVVDMAKKNGALGCCLSGAGPTMIAFLDHDYRQFVQRMKHAMNEMQLPWRVELLDICHEGAVWEIEE